MSKKENVRFLPPVKRYVNAVERRLHLPLREKARVMSDISTSIAARHEAGESYEAIMADMGTPEAVAQPFNQAFAGQYKGSAWRFLWLALALAVLATTAAVLIFTAGVGENSPELREKISSGLDFMGVKIDHTKNLVRGEEAIVSTDDSRVKIMVIPTNEELVIAQDTARLVSAQ